MSDFEGTSYIRSKIELLEESKNLIFTGAPGTGKTYLAEQIAFKMIFPDKNLNDINNLNEDDKRIWGTQYHRVQFHPSYDYTDFVEGLRPIKPDGVDTIGFKLKNGTFKEFCMDALEAYRAWDCGKTDDGTEYEKMPPFVFLIDEINRGEISKIFGELFLSIEPSKRGTEGKVITQYANIQEEGGTIFDPIEGKGWFYVPKNVYIIGTMNDIDRSVESFDFAMRRRFVWNEITAEESYSNMGLGTTEGYKNSPMKKINDVIEKIQGLNPSYHIGGSYFLHEKNESKRWEFHLKPLLREYLRGMDTKEHRDILEKSKSLDAFLLSINPILESNNAG
jgi:5-methylcytosine-specific restriction endonuclease McrBC GTP-binding regulatory subunit McrB